MFVILVLFQQLCTAIESQADVTFEILFSQVLGDVSLDVFDDLGLFKESLATQITRELGQLVSVRSFHVALQ